MNIRREMEKINNLLNGELTNDLKYSVIDYKFNGDFKSLWSDEVEQLYQDYIDLQDEIDRYIENSGLDDVLDKDKIKDYFKNENIINNYYFEINQAVLVDFEQFVVYYLEFRDKKEYLIEKLVDFETEYDIFDTEDREISKEDIEKDLITLKDMEKYRDYYVDIMISEDNNENREFMDTLKDIIVTFNEIIRIYINL